MEFREGMLGVVVVALALMGAVFVSYFAGVESEQREYTAYEYMADVSGLFEYDQSPTYIEFDPSTNYTGYYSTNTGEYWPDGYVDYVSNVNPTTGEIRPNNYRIELEPTNATESNVPLDTLDADGPFDSYSKVIAFSNTNYDFDTYFVHTSYLSKVIEAMEYPDGYTEIYFRSTNPYNESEIQPGDLVRWNIFSTVSMWNHYDILIGEYLNEDKLYVWSEDKFEQENLRPGARIDGENPYEGKVTVYRPYLSCKVNLEKNTVSLYYDWNCQEFAEQVGLDNVVVSYGGTILPGDDGIEYNSNLTSWAWTLHYDYLDPNYGVAMEE